MNDYAGKFKNISFYARANNYEIMYVTGSGLTEKIASDIQRDVDAIQRLSSLGFRKLVFKTSKKDIEVNLTKKYPAAPG